MGVPGDLEKALSLCLCKENLSDLSAMAQWWERLKQQAGEDPSMSDEVYDRLLARFCGPATIVDIPTVTKPRIVLRTEEEAIADTGFRMSSLVLYPEQVDLLQCQTADRELMYLFGPAGTGKTVVITLRGIQWLQNNEHVEIVSIGKDGVAISQVIKQQMLLAFQYHGVGLPNDQLTLFNYDFNQRDEVDKAVNEVKTRARDGRLHLVIDEVTREIHVKFSHFMRKLSNDVQHVSVWCASLHRFQGRLPDGLRTVCLSVPVRCPPAVGSWVSLSEYIGETLDCPTPSYSARPSPAATDGPIAIMLDRHTKHLGTGGHTLGYQEDCGQCGTHIADMLKDACPTLFQRNAARTPCGLEWRDVLILCDSASDTCNMVRGLRDQNIPVSVITPHSSLQDKQDMALAKNDKVIVTDCTTASGLERRIVVGMQQNIVTVILHWYGKFCVMPRAKRWTIVGLMVLVLALLIQNAPCNTMRRLLLVGSIEACVVIAFTALSTGLNKASDLTRWEAEFWKSCIYLALTFVLTVLSFGMVIMLVWWLIDEASGVLAASCAFGILGTGAGATSYASTGLIILGTSVGLIVGHGIGSLCLCLLGGIGVERLGVIVFELVGGFVGGTVGGAMAGKLTMKGNWRKGLRRGLAITSFLTILWVLFDATSSATISKVSDRSVHTTSMFLGGLSAFAMLGMVLGLHGGMLGRVVSAAYNGRLGGRFYYILLLMMLLVTCFLLMALHALHIHLTAVVEATELYTLLVVFWLLYVMCGTVSSWAYHKLACHRLVAMSRCTSLLLWMEEPLNILLWLMYARDT